MNSNKLTHRVPADPEMVAAPLDPSTLEYYDVLARESIEVVRMAESIRERLDSLDEATFGFHPGDGSDGWLAALRILSGSARVWDILAPLEDVARG